MIKQLKETQVFLSDKITEDEDGQLSFDGSTLDLQSTSPVMLEVGDYVRHYGDGNDEIYRVTEIHERFDDLDDLDSAVYFCQVEPVTEAQVVEALCSPLASYIRLGT